MNRSRLAHYLSLATLACAIAFEASAGAAQARPEAAAQSALKKAAVDYRAKRYAAAGNKLQKALGNCGDDGCSPATRAALLRDLGTMQFKQGDTASAQKSFADALALEPDIDLNERYDKPDVRAAWDEAKQHAADAAKASKEPEPPPPPPPTPPPPPPAPETPPPPPPPAPATYAHFWIGVAGTLDLLVFPSGVDLCKLSPQTGAVVNPSHLYCTNPDGTDFPTRLVRDQNDALVPGQAGTVTGGLAFGDVRAMVTADYAVAPSVLLGVRVGYVMNTYPGTAAVKDGRAWGKNIHAEVRGTYLFGDEPLAHIGFAPMAFVAGGMAEFDGHLASDVMIEGVAGTRRVNVWIIDSPWFLSVGGGMRYQLSLRAAFTAAARVNFSFQGNGLLPTAGPEVGLQYGL